MEVGGHRLSLSNLEKVMYPEVGFTKGQVIDYYTRVAPAVLPHLRDRPLTLKRYPNGVTGKFFYEKNCPKHRPSWVKTARIDTGSKKIERAVDSDAMQPRAEVCPLFEAIDLTVGAEKCLLHHVIGIMFIRSHSIGHPEDGSTVTLDEEAERVRIAVHSDQLRRCQREHARLQGAAAGAALLAGQGRGGAIVGVDAAQQGGGPDRLQPGLDRA